MSRLPLAVYTAHEGLSWNYPKDQISYAELDACRRVFGQLPDFDAGDSGFDGVWATERKVFIMRCQQVKNWDFRGRDSVYLSVTWIAREEITRIDIEELLNASELGRPFKNPPLECSCVMSNVERVSSPLPLEKTVLNNFQSLAYQIASLPLTASLKARRKDGQKEVEVHIDYDVETNDSSITNNSLISADASCDDESIMIQLMAQKKKQKLAFIMLFFIGWFAIIACLYGKEIYAYILKLIEMIKF